MESKPKFKDILINLDDIHYSYRRIDSANKFWNFIITPRWDGKSTNFIVGKAYRAFYEEGRPSILFRRDSVDLGAFAQSKVDEINEFLKDEFKLVDNVTFKTGQAIADVFIDGKIFLRIISIHQRMTRLKSLIVPRLKYTFFDEFIINTAVGEKYIQKEGWIVKEIVNTYMRASVVDGKVTLRNYMCANPYSLFHPIFVELGIPPTKLKMGEITTGATWAVDRHMLSDKLRTWLKENNPIYNEDDEYSQYALEGNLVNDKNIRIVATQPKNFALLYAFYIDGRYFGVYTPNYIESDYENGIYYWVSELKDVGKRKQVYTFDFNDLIEGSVVYDRKEKKSFIENLGYCMRKRTAVFADLNTAYIFQNFYNAFK